MTASMRAAIRRERHERCPNWLPGKPPCESNCPRCRGWLWIVARDPKPARPQTKEEAL